MKEKLAAKRVVYYHDSHGYGGMEFYMLRLMRYIDSTRYLPMVMVPGFEDPFRSSSSHFVNDVQAAGIPLLRPENPGNKKGARGLNELFSMARLLGSHQVDILHIHTCRPEGARKATVAARLARVPAVIRSEHFPPEITSRRLTPLLVKPTDWITDSIVTGSEGDRQGQIQKLKRSPSKVCRIYNSVELDRFIPDHDPFQAKMKVGLDPKIPVIGTVGRLAAQKGHRYLVEALPKVIKQYGPVCLLLVGDGELRNELENLAHKLGVANSVNFVGFKDDVLPYMQATDIAVMPSLFEVFSLAMLEFMALGKPVIASDHSSFKEAIRDGESGLLVPMKNSQALAAAILMLLRDETLRAAMGRAGMERVQAEFSFQRLAYEMMSLYERVLSKERSG